MGSHSKVSIMECNLYFSFLFIAFTSFESILMQEYPSSVPEDRCCLKKMLNNVNYSLVDYYPTPPYNCTSGCIYEEDITGGRFCFGSGIHQPQCSAPASDFLLDDLDNQCLPKQRCANVTEFEGELCLSDENTTLEPVEETTTPDFFIPTPIMDFCGTTCYESCKKIICGTKIVLCRTPSKSRFRNRAKRFLSVDAFNKCEPCLDRVREFIY